MMGGWGWGLLSENLLLCSEEGEFIHCCILLGVIRWDDIGWVEGW